MKHILGEILFYFIALFGLVLSGFNNINAAGLEFMINKYEGYPMFEGHASNPVLILNDRLYVLGGAEHISSRSGVYKLNISGGDISQIILDNTSLPLPLIYHSGITYSNHIYILGGVDESIGGRRVTDQVSSLDVTNVNGQWINEKPLPIKMARFGSAIVNNIIYTAGGESWDDEYHVFSTVYKNVIDSNTRLTNWEQQLNMPIPMGSPTLLSYKNKLYVLGASINDNLPINDVLRADIDSIGNVISWEFQKSLPKAVHRPIVNIINNYIFVIGGFSNGSFNHMIQYAMIYDDGSLSDWETIEDNNIPAICCTGSEVKDNSIFVGGGYADNGYLNYITKIKLLLPYENINIPTVIVPGIGAGWNYEALVGGRTDVPDTQWKIPNLINIYQPLINDLMGSGYTLNKNLFVYAYDWRKNISSTADNLNDFIANTVLQLNPEATQVKLVGHSMGGLVARLAAGKDTQNHIKDFLTVGSPNLGSAKSYYAWEGGFFKDYDILSSALIRTLLAVNQKGFDPEVTLIHKLVPSMQGLLPVYNYLRNSNGSLVSWNSLKSVNNALPTINSAPPLEKWNIILGDNKDTINIIKTTKRNWLDEMLRKWEDGRPNGDEFAPGDGTVTTVSAGWVGLLPEKITNLLNTNHKEVISTTQARTAIMKYLGKEASAAEAQITPIEKMLIITIASPPDFKVITPEGQTISSEDKLVMIPNPSEGNYKVEVSGNVGKYTLYFGRIKGEDSAWDKQSGEITSAGEIDSYSFGVNWKNNNLGTRPLVRAREKLGSAIGLISSSGASKNTKEQLTRSLNMLTAATEKLEGFRTLPVTWQVTVLMFQTEEKEIEMARKYKLLNNDIGSRVAELVGSAKMDIIEDLSDAWPKTVN